MREMRLQQEHIKDGVDSSFNLLNITEYQAVSDDDSFESGTDLSPLKHQQKFLQHFEQQQDRKQSKLKRASTSLASPPTKRQSATPSTTLFRVEDNDDDNASSHSLQHHHHQKQVQFNLQQQFHQQPPQSHSSHQQQHQYQQPSQSQQLHNQQPAHSRPFLGLSPLLSTSSYYGTSYTPATPHDSTSHPHPCLLLVRPHHLSVTTPCIMVQHPLTCPILAPSSSKVMSQEATPLEFHQQPWRSNHNFLPPLGNNRLHPCQPFPLPTQQHLTAAMQPTGSWLSSPCLTQLSMEPKSVTHLPGTPPILAPSHRIQSFSSLL
jgi:hypothetical protein